MKVRSLFLVVLFLLPQAMASDIFALEIKGPITFATVQAFSEALTAAKTNNTPLVLIIDTPGGAVEHSMEIARRIESSRIPVIAYVEGRDFGAIGSGAFIVMGSHAAAMSPVAVIGPAHPVTFTKDGYVPLADEKAVGSLVARLSETAKKRGRNTAAAEGLVNRNVGFTAAEALDLGIVDFVSPDVQSLLAQLDGRELNTSSGKRGLDTGEAGVKRFESSLPVALLGRLSDPTLAFLLLVFGIYIMVFGVATVSLGAQIGGLVIITLGVIGTWLKVDPLGMLLLAVGIVLLTREIHTPGFSVVGFSGILLLMAGSFLVVPATYPHWIFSQEYRNTLFLSIAVPSLLFAGFLIYAFRHQYQVPKTVSFMDTHKGETAMADDGLGPGKEGCILFMGERWKATSKEPIGKGESVTILRTKGDSTLVKKAKKS